MDSKGQGTGNVLAVGAAVALILGLGIGFFAGNMKGKSDGATLAEQKFAPIVEFVFPKPPAELTALSGTVKGLYGASIALEVQDPDDYLPHPDRSPRRTEVRTANVTPSTTYMLVNFRRLDRQGNPARTTLAFNDLKEGDAVTVKSMANIKDTQSFEATAVEVVRY